MFERRHEPLLHRRSFVHRVAKSFLVGLAIIGFSLGIGMVGFHSLDAKTTWIDAFLNASMLLSGMGPIGPGPQTTACKLFAGFYALYSGLAVLLVAGITFAPIIHRIFHRFHLAEDDDERGHASVSKRRMDLWRRNHNS